MSSSVARSLLATVMAQAMRSRSGLGGRIVRFESVLDSKAVT